MQRTQRMVSPARSGFTLVEVLVATMIVALVGGIVLLLYQAVDRTGLFQKQEKMRVHDTHLALVQLAEDLQGCFVPLDEEHPFVLAPEEDAPRLSFFSAKRVAGREGAAAGAEIRQIQYTWTQGLSRAAPSPLYCINAPLTGPEAAVTNRLVQALEGLSFKAFDGEAWMDHWPPEVDDPTEEASPDPTVPVSIEISLHPLDGDPICSRVLIPIRLIAERKREQR